MKLVYVCARATYLHLDLTRVLGAYRFWSVLQRRVPSVVSARVGPDRVELLLCGTPGVEVKRRVHLAIRHASLEAGIPLGTWSMPLEARAVAIGREAQRTVVDMALSDMEEGRACDGLEPLFSTFRDCIGASARPWVDHATVAHALGIPRLELALWAAHADGQASGGRKVRMPVPMALTPHGRVDSVGLARAVSAAYRCPPPLIAQHAQAWSSAGWAGARLGLDLDQLAPRLGGVGAALSKVVHAQACGEGRPSHEELHAVQLCLGDPRLVRAVPAHRVVMGHAPAFAVPRLAVSSARW